MSEVQNRQRPYKFEPGQRVRMGGDSDGRVQGGYYDADRRTFRYIVKWDNGPTTTHDEGELAPAQLPPHYLGKDS